MSMTGPQGHGRTDGEGPAGAPETGRRPDAEIPYVSTPRHSPADGEGTEDRWPVPGWDRYRCEKLIGEGGAGTVFRAWDPRLNRRVALKFLKSDDAELVARFLREARAQAHIEHPNVCKVYEVGDVEGRAYIAMQYIDGASLKERYPAMTLEQRALVIRQVAEAVQEAHRRGIVHRDLKPSNIMLEQSEDGSWRPFVVDFGLVHEEGGESLTVSGMTLGTPAYMSPEQARGETLLVDRRSDVYSLGATLYEIIARQPPFSGVSPVETMLRLLQDDPPPLSRLVPKVSPDLENIVMKCLEKNPQRRYDSARALADDLGRFLDGEPVLARRAGFLYRAGRRLRKNRAFSVLTVVSLVAVAVLAGLWWHARSNAALQAELAQRFGQRVEQAEGILWRAQSLPPHDIRPTRKLVRQLLVSIEADMKRYGGLAEGSGHAALGRGYLALHDYLRAREHLESAWAAGYRTPETAYALGLTFARLFHDELGRLSAIADKKRKEAFQASAERRLRDPAAAFIRLSLGMPTASPAYLEALLAFFAKDYDGALRKAREAVRKTPWLYEANALQGAVFQARARQDETDGKLDAAERGYRDAEKAYLEAASIARSDGLVLCDLAEVYHDLLFLDVWKRDRLRPEIYHATLSACRRSLDVDPDSAVAHLLLMESFADHAEWAFRKGEDPSRELAESIRIGESLLRVDPRNVRALELMGISLWQTGQGCMESDPVRAEACFLRGIRSVEQALALAPEDARAWDYLGLVCMEMANLRVVRKQDPSEYVRKGAGAFRKSLALNPDLVSSLVNRALILEVWLEYLVLRGLGDPVSVGREALECLARAAVKHADLYWIPRTAGMIHFQLAQWQARQGKDPSGELEAARTNLDRSLTLNPGDKDAVIYLVDLDLWVAERDRQAGRSSTAALRRAKVDLERVDPALRDHPDIASRRKRIAEAMTEKPARTTAIEAPSLPTQSSRGLSLPPEFWILRSYGSCGSW
ncbi:MAG: protein kinase [Acidobacteria bacterium]|nr:protein kinase [Acidobacteriota bacterium]